MPTHIVGSKLRRIAPGLGMTVFFPSVPKDGTERVGIQANLAGDVPSFQRLINNHPKINTTTNNGELRIERGGENREGGERLCMCVWVSEAG